MESLLIRLVVGLIVLGVIFGIVRLVLPQLGLPPWVTQAVLLLLGALALIWLLYTLIPLLHTAM